MDCTIRPVHSSQELAEAFDVLGAQFPTPFDRHDRRFADLARRYPQDRTLMLVAERASGHLVGGALAFRDGEGSVGCDTATLRLIAVVEAQRGKGLGRRLIERIEGQAVVLGVGTIYLGAGPDVRGFYLRLGYSGRSRMSKALAGSVVAHYGQADNRRQALDDLRMRKAQRQATVEQA